MVNADIDFAVLPLWIPEKKKCANTNFRGFALYIVFIFLKSIYLVFMYL